MRTPAWAKQLNGLPKRVDWARVEAACEEFIFRTAVRPGSLGKMMGLGQKSALKVFEAWCRYQAGVAPIEVAMPKVDVFSLSQGS